MVDQKQLESSMQITARFTSVNNELQAVKALALLIANVQGHNFVALKTLQVSVAEMEKQLQIARGANARLQVNS